MNLQHIRYALEVNRSGSITQAAENLYMNQPNLSKAIREFEEELGYKIFNRTSKGMTTTQKGEIFLLRGKKILSDIRELEDLFRLEESPSGISMVVSRYFPFSNILNDILNSPEATSKSSWHIIEMDDDNIIQQIAEGLNRLGIIRYPSIYDLYVRQYLKGKSIDSKLLAQNSRSLVFSNKSPLSKLQSLSKESIAHREELQLYLKPSRHLPEDSNLSEISVDDETVKKATFLFSDIASALEVLVSNPNVYMVMPSPLPENTLKRYNLSQTVHWDDSIMYSNRLIYSHSHTFSVEEKIFINLVQKNLSDVNGTLLYDNLIME